MVADPRSVDGRRETERFARVAFDQFRNLALDPSLSTHERIGFPDAFREGREGAIWRDIVGKMPVLQTEGARILDIGPGCGPLPKILIDRAQALGQQVIMIDHEEMLAQLPTSPVLTKVAGRFPDVLAARPEVVSGGFDAILAYSVLQTVLLDANPSGFVDAALALLRPGGHLLLGDIPNFSKLRRFLASDAGVEHHKAYMRTSQAPSAAPFATATDRIDDGLLMGLVLRARLAGFDAYVMPQAADLPLSNRREDLLMVRP